MQPQTLKPTDTVLRETRALALFIIPFLVVAAVLLTVWPDHTDITFAWTIKPTMTPMMLAAAYIGGIYFFSRVASARRWHAVKVGFWPVIAFASILCVATVLHWDRFNHSHISFFAWAGLYFTTPFLVFAIWLRNRPQDTGQVEPGDVKVPLLFRLGIGGVGLVTLGVSVFLFALPALMISAWPWTLTPLTARVVSAMFALPGLVGLGMAVEPRWSGNRVILESQAVSILVILISAGRAWAEFNQANMITWLFVGGLSALLLAEVALYAGMEIYRVLRR